MTQKMTLLLERMRKVAETKAAADGLGTVDPNHHANEGNAAPFAGPPEDATTMRTGEQAAANASQLADAVGPAHHEKAPEPGNATDDVDTNSSGVTGTTGSSPELSADGLNTNGALDENKTTVPGATTEVKSAGITVDSAKKLTKTDLTNLVKSAGTALLAELAIESQRTKQAGTTKTASDAEKNESFEAGQKAGQAILEQQRQLQYAAGVKVATVIEDAQTAAFDLLAYFEARTKQAEEEEKSEGKKKPAKKAEGEGEDTDASSMPVAVEDASDEEEESVEDSMGGGAPAEGGDPMGGMGGDPMGGMGGDPMGGGGGGGGLGGIDPAALAEIIQLLTQAGPGALPEEDMMALGGMGGDPMGGMGGDPMGGGMPPKMGSAKPGSKTASQKKQAELFNRVLSSLRERLNK